MKFPLVLLSVLLAARCAFAEDTGVIEGKVALPAPSAPPVVAKRYEIVARDGVVATNPPRAVVYLEGDFPAPASPAVAKVEQRDMAFVPPLLPIRVGTRVEFPNHDNTFHNVFSFSPAKRFDLGRYRPSDAPVPSQVFDAAGLVTLRCEIHQHMRGLILVLPTPHFVISEPDGTYRLSGLPAGKYRLKAWIDSKTTREQEVEIGAGSTVRADFP